MIRHLALVLVAAACAERGPAASAQPNYELDCASANTANAAQLHCIRTDTRTGDVLVVDYMKLPVSNGPTASSAALPGRFTTACAATSTDTRAELYCIRMNTETGELLVINLTKVGSVPPHA